MSKVLTLCKRFQRPPAFATTFCFAYTEHIILLLLRALNNISTVQFSQTNQVFYDQKLANQLIWLTFKRSGKNIKKQK